MSSFARGLLVLEAFTYFKRPVSISQVSSRTGLSRAAVRRCLYTLTCLGFATNKEQRFALMPKSLALGYGYLASTPFAHAAQPVLERIAGTLHESCSLSVLDGNDIIYVARVTVNRFMTTDLQIGTRLPAFCTSMGRVMLAHLPPQQLESYLRTVKLRSFTPRTVTSGDKLCNILKTVQRNDYAVVNQEFEMGLRTMGVPVRSCSGKVVAALNIGTHVQRVPLAFLMTKCLPVLQESAREIGMLVP